MWILLVGVNQYQDEHFPALAYSAVDCQELGAALTDAIKEFPRKQIITHHDFAAFPTFEAVFNSLKQIISSASSQDTVLFYFSGHGVIEQTSQQAVLCLSDTQNDSLLTTGLQMQELLHLLESCAARYQLIWLDACHSGNMLLHGGKGVEEPTIIGSFEPTAQLVKVLRSHAAHSRGSYALLSCNEGQRSWEFPELGHGVFTYYLIQGLRGEAADAQGVIEADGLYRYVHRQTVDYIDQKNKQLRLLNEEKKRRQESPLFPEYPPQTPKRIVEGVGELAIGLIPHRDISAPLSILIGAQSSPSKTDGSENREALTPVAEPPKIATQPETLMEPSSPHPSESTLAARKQLSVFGYVTLALAMLAGGFALGSLTGNGQFLQRLNPIAQTTKPCNFKANTLPTSQQPMNAQISFPNCMAGTSWQQLQVQTFVGRLGAVWWVALTPDGNTLASVSGSAAEVRDLRTSKILHVLKGHRDVIQAIAISPDGNTLATGSADKIIKLWNLPTGDLLQTLTGHAGVIWSLNFTPDGKILASGGGDSTIRLWNVQTGQILRTISGHKDRLFPVVFSPDGTILASGSKDTTIKLWNWKTGKMLRNLPGHKDTVRALVFDPEGKRLASGSWDSTVKLWDVQTGEELNTFTGHINNVVSVAFSPDGKILASGGIDNTVKLWDLDKQTLLATLHGHLDWVLSVVFSSNGKTLVSGSRDGMVAVWTMKK